MSFTDLGKATGLSTSAVHQRVKRLEQRGLILGYGATVNHDEIGLPLTAFISIRPIDPSQPDDSPERLRDITEIESCWSVAGEESYILKIRVPTPADLEHLLARIRAAANVSTRTTIVLSTPYENRPVTWRASRRRKFGLRFGHQPQKTGRKSAVGDQTAAPRDHTAGRETSPRRTEPPGHLSLRNCSSFSRRSRAA